MIGDELTAYCAVSPAGQPIGVTIAKTPDDAWRHLRAAVTEPDTLIDKGWRVGRLQCTLVQILHDE